MKLTLNMTKEEWRQAELWIGDAAVFGKDHYALALLDTIKVARKERSERKVLQRARVQSDREAVEEWARTGRFVND